MSVEFSDAAPIPVTGDFKFLAEGARTMGNGAAGYVAVGSFVIPALTNGGNLENKSVIVFIDILRVAGTQSMGANTSATSGDGAGTKPCAFTSTGAHAWAKAEVFGATTDGASWMVNYLQRGSSGTSTAVTDNTFWGDTSAAQTIYVNILRATATIWDYKWHAYLIGQGVY